MLFFGHELSLDKRANLYRSQGPCKIRLLTTSQSLNHSITAVILSKWKIMSMGILKNRKPKVLYHCRVADCWTAFKGINHEKTDNCGKYWSFWQRIFS